jgi:hypothetical protein
MPWCWAPPFPLVLLIERHFNFRIYNPNSPPLRFIINKVAQTNEPVGCSGWSINTRAETTMSDNDNKDAKATSAKLPAKKQGLF